MNSLKHLRRGPEGLTVVLGGGLSGLAAGYVLGKAGRKAVIFESGPEVGGLSRTIVKDGFRFDLGGHRFFTKDKAVEDFVRELMDGELVEVSRKSKIYLRGKYFNYPLKPLNSMFGLGPAMTFKILFDYGKERLKEVVNPKGRGTAPNIAGARSADFVAGRACLEDWVVRNFGRTMFDLYFKPYSEKVWGIDCKDISAEWVEKRIQGLSLGTAIKNAFFRLYRDIPTLADRFLYPRLGIGRISERMEEEIEKHKNPVHTGMSVVRVDHNGRQIEGIEVGGNGGGARRLEGADFISSIPLNALVGMLRPLPPGDVLDAAGRLRYRDLVIVSVMVDRPGVTDQTWIYMPGRDIPFGRIHEPKNWSPDMCPEGKTLVVAEYFCFKGDGTWSRTDGELSGLTVDCLEGLGFFKKAEVSDSMVVRVPNAYPLFDVGYRGHVDKIVSYLDRFENLHIAGRSGMFRYYNMDHAIQSGIEAAKGVMDAA